MVIPTPFCHKNSKFQELFKAIEKLEKEKVPIFNVCVNYSNNDNIITSCGFLKRDNKLLVFAENNTLRVMSLDSFGKTYNSSTFTHHSDYIYSVDISQDNTTLVSGSADGTLCIYHLNSKILIKKCTGHLGAIVCVKISDCCRFVASGSKDSTVRVWQLDNGKLLRIFCNFKGSVTSVSFHPNSKYLVAGSADGKINLWCLTKAICVCELSTVITQIFNLSFSPCGKILAGASGKSIKMWNLMTSKVLAELTLKDSDIVRLVWNREGSEIGAATLDGTVGIWNVSRIYKNFNNTLVIKPAVIHTTNSKILSIDFAFGTYGILRTRTVEDPQFFKL